MSIAGVVLNGGQSSRMGQDKSELLLQGQSLIIRAQYLLQSAGIESIFVSGPQGIADETVGAGPLSGLYSSLKQLTDHEFVLFMPVDMPLITTAMIKQLCKNKLNEVAHYDGSFFPMLIRNNSKMREQLSKQLTTGSLAIHQLLSNTDSLAVSHDWPKECFMNANTPEQWDEITAILNQ